MLFKYISRIFYFYTEFFVLMSFACVSRPSDFEVTGIKNMGIVFNNIQRHVVFSFVTLT